MKDRLKIGKGLEVISLARKRAAVNMIGAFNTSIGGLSATPAAVVSMSLSDESITALNQVSLQEGERLSHLPQDSDFIYAVFRALSATIIPGHWVDFSKPGVLEKATPMFMGQTVYKNHGEASGIWGARQFDVEKYLGSVSQAVWDGRGEKVGGVPGVNVEMKIDALANPRIARGLLMKPPAIHSCSETVLFDFDYSHPDLVEQDRFWRMLGEEVDGETVRFVVTEIIGLHELSLVFQGADQIAKQIPEGDEEEDELNDQRTGTQFSGSGGRPPSQLQLAMKKEHTVKLTAEQKKKFGLEAHQGEEVGDAIVLGAVELQLTQLTTRATSADAIVAASRAEVLRLATLAEGTGEGETRKLPEVTASLINGADPSQLAALTTMYQEKFDKAFPLTCEQGHKVGRRSSVENPAEAKEELSADAEEDTHLL
jgi:hypothetical protein